MTESARPPLLLAIDGFGVCLPDQDLATRTGIRDCEMDLSLLAPLVRRRTSQATRVAVSAATRACREAGQGTDMAAVFVSAIGEIQTTDKLCEVITAADFPLSPTLFHNSVHNTAAGYWSIASGSKAPMQAMAGLNDCFRLGLLEAWLQIETGADRVLLVCYDETMPSALQPEYNWQPCAIALVLGAAPGQRATLLAPVITNKPADSLCLEQLVKENQAMVALPLIRRLQEGVSGSCQVALDPCFPDTVAELQIS